MPESTQRPPLSRRELGLAIALLGSLSLTAFLAIDLPPTGSANETPRLASPPTTQPPTVQLSVTQHPVTQLPVTPPRANQPLAGLSPGPSSTPPCFLGVVLAEESVDVATEVDGRLREVLVQPGDRVEQGTRLALLSNESLRHQLEIERGQLHRIEADLRSLTYQVEGAQNRHRRRLALEGLLSREEAESSQLELEMARSRLEVAQVELEQAQVRLAQLEANRERLEIRAPFAGTIALQYLDRGTVISRGTVFARLISAEASRVRFAVDPTEADALQKGTQVRVEVENLGQTLWGQVKALAPEVDAASEMIFAEAHLDPGQPQIPPGSVARVSALRGDERTVRCLDHPPSSGSRALTP